MRATWHNCYKATLLIGCIGLALNTQAANSQYQPAKTIMKTAERFVRDNTAITKQQRLEVKANDLDPRLKLSRCEKPIEAFFPHQKRQGKNRTVGIQCNGKRPWKIFVPVKVKIMSPALVLTHRMNPGEIIQPDDVELQTRDISTMAYGYFSDYETIRGYSAKRSLAHGTLLSPNELKAPLLIKRGQTVTLSASSGSLAIKMNGQAMSDGTLGQLIKVKNLSSGRIVEGTVQKNGSVKINF